MSNSVIGSYVQKGTSRNIYIKKNGQIALVGGDVVIPDHIAVRSSWLDGAPQAVVDGVEARARNVGRTVAPYWGTLLDVPSGGSVTAAAGVVLNAIRTGGAAVFFSVETTPSAAGEENLLTCQYAITPSDGWLAASGTTPSLTQGVITARACTAVNIPAGPPWVRLTVSSTQNAAVTDAYVVKYGLRF